MSGEVIAASIAALVTIGVTIFNHYDNKKANDKAQKQNQEFRAEAALQNTKFHEDNKRLLELEQVREGITRHRVDWIQKVRTLSVAFVQHVHGMNETQNQEEHSAFYRKALGNWYELSLLLNVFTTFDNLVNNYAWKLLKTAFDNGTNSGKGLSEQMDPFIVAMRIYLKAEWQRVKYDSDPNNTDQFDERAAINEIISQNQTLKAMKKIQEDLTARKWVFK